ncbi:hypothetical protein C8F04DRAFT_1293867 [Mycena alexandri]|uniref:Uncharacterized protein n=1 Tax=Mycena alexandri TaxID=1745969 RepID=A0AAD6SIT9_9AGAR|nr:hypothetical protein C8F04DRAFT_1293867 [Mycena alexandri]
MERAAERADNFSRQDQHHSSSLFDSPTASSVSLPSTFSSTSTDSLRPSSSSLLGACSRAVLPSCKAAILHQACVDFARTLLSQTAPQTTSATRLHWEKHAYLDLPMLGPRTTRTWGTARLANRVRTPAHRLRTHYPPTSRRGVRYVRGVSAAWWERDLEGAYVPSALYLFFFNHVLFPSLVPISHPLLHPRPRPRVPGPVCADSPSHSAHADAVRVEPPHACASSPHAADYRVLRAARAMTRANLTRHARRSRRAETAALATSQCHAIPSLEDSGVSKRLHGLEMRQLCAAAARNPYQLKPHAQVRAFLFHLPHAPAPKTSIRPDPDPDPDPPSLSHSHSRSPSLSIPPHSTFPPLAASVHIRIRAQSSM